MSYESGMDTIIQPVHEKERSGFSSIINIIIGIIIYKLFNILLFLNILNINIINNIT